MEKLNKQKNSSRIILISGIFLLFFISIIFFVSNKTQKTSVNQVSKTQPLALDTSVLAKESTVSITNDTAVYSLQGYNQTLIRTQETGVNAAWEYIRRAPGNGRVSLIPANYPNEATLVKSEKDKEDPFFQKNNIQSTNEHYFFDQTIKGIPVFGAQLIIHLRNGNELYSVDANLVKNQTVPEQKLTEEQAQVIAMQKARTEAPANVQLITNNLKKYIINKKVLGIDKDEKNYLTYSVPVVTAENASSVFGKNYFVDLETGTIVFEKEIFLNAVNRQVTGTVTRNEGQPATGNQSVDNAYDWLGEYYNYFFTNFQRDGNDGKGAAVKVKISGNSTASTNPKTLTIAISADMLAKDVLLHEDTHIFNFGTVGSFNDGSMEEGNSDTWACLIQSDWVMSAKPPTIDRNPQSPTSSSQPEKLFSPNWACSGDQHENGTLISHTLYLMAKGGTENGCTIAGIGDLNAAKVHYQAQTKYMKAAGGYGDIYTAENNACNDLFTQGSAQCIAVQAAMMATELDQQPAGTTINPKCSGGAEKKPVCPASVPASTNTATSSPALQTQAIIPSSGVIPSFFTCLGSCPTVILPSQTAQPVSLNTNASTSAISSAPLASGGTNISNINQLSTVFGQVAIGGNGNEGKHLGRDGLIQILIFLIMQLLSAILNGSR